jgi:hypothetical protein
VILAQPRPQVRLEIVLPVFRVRLGLVVRLAAHEEDAEDGQECQQKFEVFRHDDKLLNSPNQNNQNMNDSDAQRYR